MQLDAQLARRFADLLEQRFHEMWDVDEHSLLLTELLVEECGLDEERAVQLAVAEAGELAEDELHRICVCFQFAERLLILALQRAGTAAIIEAIAAVITPDEPHCDRCRFYRTAISLFDDGFTNPSLFALEVVAHCIRPVVPDLEESEGRLRLIEIYDGLDYPEQMLLVQEAEKLEAQVIREEHADGVEPQDSEER